MSSFCNRKLATIDLDRVLGGATTAATSALSVRAGAMPSEVKEALLRHTGQDPLGSEIDPGAAAAPHAPTTASTASTANAAHAASPAAASHAASTASAADTSATADAAAPARSHGGGAHRAAGSPHAATPAEADPANFHPSAATPADPTSGVPFPAPRPDFEGQNSLNQFAAHDATNRANGLYGAFGEPPTGSGTPYVDESQHGMGAAYQSQHNGLNDLPLPQYPTEAPIIDTTGVTPLYSDAELAQNRSALGSYQDTATPVHSDALPSDTGAPNGGSNVAVADNNVSADDQSLYV